jgi:hypothetical protein
LNGDAFSKFVIYRIDPVVKGQGLHLAMNGVMQFFYKNIAPCVFKSSSLKLEEIQESADKNNHLFEKVSGCADRTISLEIRCNSLKSPAWRWACP